jgi:hypothetical protein
VGSCAVEPRPNRRLRAAAGARALEEYPRITPDEIHVGSRSAFAAAGFTEISHPTHRVVMRTDF